MKINELIEIRLSNHSHLEKVKSDLLKLLRPTIESLNIKEAWSDSISRVILTDNFERDFTDQAEKWGVREGMSMEKDYSVVSKILFNDNVEEPIYQIFIDIIHLPLYSLNEVLFSQVLNIHYQRLIPNSLSKKFINRPPQSLMEHIEFAIKDWCVSYNVDKDLDNYLGEKRSSALDRNKLLISFKRKLKRSLYRYNGDDDSNTYRINRFWAEFYGNIHSFFLRLVERENLKEEFQLDKEEPCYELIENVMSEIQTVNNQLLNRQEISVNELKKTIVKFSEHFGVRLEKENEKNFKITLIRNPKDYFTDIIDTESRIVCFIDILGFSKLVEHYESDMSSTTLQNIQESFKMATKYILERNQTGSNEGVKHLKYQTFSDNICISIPYFDNEMDFLSNFNLLSTYVRSFQNLMMNKGIFTRGGISIGSFYSDQNIIFSTGLIKAYNLENTDAKYPRVIIDKDILNKISTYNRQKVDEFGLHSTIIKDRDGWFFLNPFDLIKSSIIQTESSMRLLDEMIFEEEPDDVINNVTSLTKQIMKNSLGLIKELEIEENEILCTIEMEIHRNLDLFEDNDYIYKKYKWIHDFLEWYKNPNLSERGFKTLNQVMIEAK